MTLGMEQIESHRTLFPINECDYFPTDTYIGVLFKCCTFIVCIFKCSILEKSTLYTNESVW